MPVCGGLASWRLRSQHERREGVAEGLPGAGLGSDRAQSSALSPSFLSVSTLGSSSGRPWSGNWGYPPYYYLISLLLTFLLVVLGLWGAGIWAESLGSYESVSWPAAEGRVINRGTGGFPAGVPSGSLPTGSSACTTSSRCRCRSDPEASPAADTQGKRCRSGLSQARARGASTTAARPRRKPRSRPRKDGVATPGAGAANRPAGP